jgi:hypothetical protein
MFGGCIEDTNTRAIDNFIVRLHRYIEDDPTRPRHLQTVRGRLPVCGVAAGMRSLARGRRELHCAVAACWLTNRGENGRSSSKCSRR